jgi:NAD(P) transhydrogenase subunit alpha
MKIAIPKERRPGEARVAATPETVKKLIALGAEVAVEAGAGAGSSIPDAQYQAAGAAIATDLGSLLSSADVVLKVQRPMSAAEGQDELASVKSGALLIGMLAPFQNRDQVADYAKRNVTAFSMELLPRITRAQAMDVLSSQSNLAGYRAVIDAGHEFGRIFPMMMTAAGTVPPARVLVLGAGVAGLQAIATAKRLGAIVSAFDVRPVVKEQVESLGATFVMVESEEVKEAETKGGYAKEMSEDYKRKQADKIHETLKKQDIAICTALIPGKKAPVLITDAMLRDMKPGSVVVDLAVESGGNCEGSEPGKIVVKHGVKIVGHTNVPSRVAVDASALYARNLLQLVALLVDKDSKQIKINWEDEIVRGTALTRDGAIVHPALTGGS